MDLQYLHWLQNLREQWGEPVERFFVIISNIDINAFIILIPSILFWCFSKHAGQIVLFTYNIGPCVNTLLKNTICCRRPFVRDPSLYPSTLTPRPHNYSFPSGHSATAVNTFGSAGWVIRNKYKILSWILWIFVALVLFSRNFLGAHTPQDVIVALINGILTIFLIELLFKYLKEHPEKDTLILFYGLIILLILSAYILLKGYPDQNITKVSKMISIRESLNEIGGVLGMLLAWFLERKLINFKDPETISLSEKGIRFIVGTIFISLCFFYIYPFLFQFKCYRPLHLFVQNIIIIFCIPLTFNKISTWFNAKPNTK